MMRLVLKLFLCVLMAAGFGFAQRGGGARGGGGGGFRGGGGFGGGGFRGGFGGGGFRGGFGGYYGGYRGFYGSYWGLGWGWPYWGLGFGYGYWPGYYPYYAYDSYGYYPYGAGYATYQTNPNVTVVYPPNQGYNAAAGVPAIRQYDQYGQEVRPSVAPGSSGSPIYLIAFNDHVIRAAAAYWVDGQTLHYVTLEHQEMQVPLNTVDRSMSLQLNTERRIPFQLPQ
jgi:hypothetical protein